MLSKLTDLYQGIILNQKNQTDSDDYCTHRRFSLKVRFWHFLTYCHSLYSQKQWFPFHTLIFIQKQLLLMTHRQRNSINQLTLSYIHQVLHPRLMWIHLVWNSTSARFEKKSQNIHLVRIYWTSANFTYYSLSANFRTKWIIGPTSWINSQ